MRGRSYTPSPPRGYGRRGRSPSPRGGRYGGRGSRDGPTSLLVRNLRRDCRPDDLRRPFGQFGQLKDVYLPRDYYTGEPRGFGFVQYLEPDDAAEAKHVMDGQVFQGRQLTVVFAEENRKKPTEMRYRERGSSHRGRGYDRRRSPPRYSRSPRYSQSPPSRYARPHHRNYSPSPERREHSRSISPPRKSMRRERSFSRTPTRYSRSLSRSPVRGDRSPPYNAASPVREHSPPRADPRSPSRSRSRSVDPLDD
ncbi:RNA splicing factor [Lithospermum erythrorhizon]|uniref:RNA splicing factor n=1 Tax=Lithospermum erythrorhizon TaxID=34254 RepID=A0AAV3RTK2_LITER